jgi:hypothetical protein
MLIDIRTRTIQVERKSLSRGEEMGLLLRLICLHIDTPNVQVPISHFSRKPQAFSVDIPFVLSLIQPGLAIHHQARHSQYAERTRQRLARLDCPRDAASGQGDAGEDGELDAVRKALLDPVAT